MKDYYSRLDLPVTATKREIEAELQHDNPDWSERMARWEASVRNGQPTWHVVRPKVDEISSGGQKYLPMEDGSFLAQGYAPTKHTVKMTVRTDFKRITAFRLELLGYKVTCMETAQKATLWLKDNLPDLIAVGHLADMESVEFLNLLSNDPRTSELPMIYVSANADLEEVQRAYNAGADEFLVTPYDPLVLEKKVEGLLTAASNSA